jgi:O-antigen/teichoic acid export membrane protein
MLRRFFRDSAVYIIPSALSSGLSLVLFPLYAHYFTPREYGALDLIFLAQSFVNFTVALEIYQAVGMCVAGEKNEALARDYASTGLLFTLGSYALFGVLAEVFASPLTHVLLGANINVVLLRIAVLWMVVQGVLALAQAQLRWQLRPRAFAAATMVNVILTMLPAGLLVLVVHLGVKGALLGQLFGSTAALICVAVMTRGTFTFRFSLTRCKEMLRLSTPLVPSSVGVFLNLYADRLIIRHSKSLADVGVYGVGYRVAMIVSLLLVGFQGAAMPLFLARKDDPATPGDIARIFKLFAGFALSVFIFLAIMATPIIRIVAAAPYQPAASVVPFLVISVLFSGMFMFAPGPGIVRKTAAMAWVAVAGGVLNVVLALLLVPRYGIKGAGAATAVASLAWFIALMTVSQRYYPVPHQWRRLGIGFIAVVAYVDLALSLLPSGRRTALDGGILGVRVGCVLIGGGVALWIILGGPEVTQLLREGGRLRVRLFSKNKSPVAPVPTHEGS